MAKRIERRPVLLLVTGARINGRSAGGDVGVTEYYAYDVRWKAEVAQNCRYGPAKVVPVPTRRVR